MLDLMCGWMVLSSFLRPFLFQALFLVFLFVVFSQLGMLRRPEENRASIKIVQVLRRVFDIALAVVSAVDSVFQGNVCCSADGLRFSREVALLS